ncbi:MAG: ornithine carbamoyltransferase [Marivibrio sp.]|uniref:ornithine carbamoyltransferase n=1 Tax=Marivibrio sp. TaxID=2039719 RepID=UPI0032EB30E1
MRPNHFLDLDRFDEASLRDMLDRGNAARDVKPGGAKPLAGKILACIFEKPSTRTRVSFDVGMKQLGGDVVVLTPAETQLGRGETIADTARVLSRYVDAIMIRTTAEEKLLELAEHARVPVINGLTDRTHPCQLMADVMTYEQHRGPITGKTIAWSGDGNNMATSWIHAAARFRFTLKIACPPELEPPRDVVDWAISEGCDLRITHDPAEAAAGADCVVTDVWVSMGDPDAPVRHNQLQPYQVDERLMARAKDDALFMHCLPAHRGEEVTEGVIDGPQSVVWDEAENRLHAQKGVLLWCLEGSVGG